MNEYILISTKKRLNEFKYDQWMYHYLLSKKFSNLYDDQVFCLWCHRFDQIDSYLKKEYEHRYDYKNYENLHTLYNQVTKEIVIIITNPYQIIVKCDRIPIGVVKTIRNYYPNIRLFCRNKDFEEVETSWNGLV